MPEQKLGLISGNKDVIAEFREQTTGYDIRVFSSMSTLKPEELVCAALDIDTIEDFDNVQFQLSRIRKVLHSLPVLLILRVGHIHRLDFEWFFDEFVLYPFRKMEVQRRLDKLIWEKNLGISDNTIKIKNLKIDMDKYSVYLNAEQIDLTFKEFELLRFLVENRDRVFSRKDLLNKIWGIEYIGGTRTVDVHIRRLRGKLGEEFNSIIETVRNVGYRCKVQE
jgi:DNA-binding response OmpR family regulator